MAKVAKRITYEDLEVEYWSGKSIDALCAKYRLTKVSEFLLRKLVGRVGGMKIVYP